MFPKLPLHIRAWNVGLIRLENLYPKKEGNLFYLTFTYRGKRIKLRDYNAPPFDSARIIKNEEYRNLDVKRKIVIDIGAYIGDSAIYFAINGAKEVIAYEPYPKTCRVTALNTKGYKCVRVINNAVTGKNGALMLNADYSGGSDLSHTGGARVASISLSSIVERYRLRDAILKIDCEGSEYEILCNSSRKTLRAFKQIELEYHYGKERLIKSLTNAGFAVQSNGPEKIYARQVKNPHMEMGMILANRIDR